MQALFIGHAYIDVTFIVDELPTGDDKAVARDYAVSFGGNAVTAGFACAKLGHPSDIMANLAGDWLSRMFLDMCHAHGVTLHGRQVKRSSLSFIMPREGKRAITRARDDAYLHPMPQLNLDGCRALHLDGHMADAALHYARECRARGILTSLDGGGLRSNTDELLEFIDVAVVAERLCEQMNLSETGMLDYLKSKGCRIGGITLGERGMVWYDETGEVRHQPALSVPKERIIDTNGAGDIFHGAYLAAYLNDPGRAWAEHFEFARGASAHAIQILGNEAKLPDEDDIRIAQALFGG